MADLIRVDPSDRPVHCKYCERAVFEVYVPAINKTIRVDVAPEYGGAPPSDETVGLGVPHDPHCPARRLLSAPQQEVRE